MTEAVPERRAGFVALVGRPNAGKSTLMNALVGERLSIVTPRAQTTWRAVTGIHTEGDTQIVFLDTPGLLEPRDLLQRTMLAAALDALANADVVAVVLDAADPPGRGERERLVDVLHRESLIPADRALQLFERVDMFKFARHKSEVVEAKDIGLEDHAIVDEIEARRQAEIAAREAAQQAAAAKKKVRGAA